MFIYIHNKFDRKPLVWNLSLILDVNVKVSSYSLSYSLSDYSLSTNPLLIINNDKWIIIINPIIHVGKILNVN